MGGLLRRPRRRRAVERRRGAAVPRVARAAARAARAHGVPHAARAPSSRDDGAPAALARQVHSGVKRARCRNISSPFPLGAREPRAHLCRGEAERKARRRCAHREKEKRFLDVVCARHRRAAFRARGAALPQPRRVAHARTARVCACPVDSPRAARLSFRRAGEQQLVDAPWHALVRL